MRKHFFRSIQLLRKSSPESCDSIVVHNPDLVCGHLDYRSGESSYSSRCRIRVQNIPEQYRLVEKWNSFHSRLDRKSLKLTQWIIRVLML